MILYASNLFLKPQKPTTPTQPSISASPIITSVPHPAINKIEISSDQKSILNAQTKKIIFTIEYAQKYLKDSGYEYNPDTFQTSKAKYAGDCFLNAALSNNKDRIVFSTGCLPGNLTQSWIGTYKISLCPKDAYCDIVASEQIKFLIGGGGNNFIWSSDDKTITYEAVLGLSGMTETRTIHSNTGEILETKK